MAVAQRAAIERDLDAAVRADALAHAEPALARHQLRRRRLAQIVAVVLEPFAHLDDVAMALGGQQADLGALVLEQRVGRHRGAVDDALGVGQHRRAVETQRLRQPIEAVHDAERLVARSRGRLGQRDASLRVDGHQIGEGAADVDADAEHASAPLGRDEAERAVPIALLGRAQFGIAPAAAAA